MFLNLPTSKVFILLVLSPFLVNALENGLARTPPMGWMAWERFRCRTDCLTDPDDCVNEQLFRQIADAMSSEGYADVGYEYVSIDDCWMASERDENGRLQADSERFPSGIKNLADYVHSKGLKLGIYQDIGTKTCVGYPGLVGSMEIDANTFAEWGVDYIKVDGCNADVLQMEQDYTAFGQYLNSTGRPIVYSCSWPFFQSLAGVETNYSKLIEACNLWRLYYDIDDSWLQVLGIMDYMASDQDKLIPLAGPGHWNDPDMLIVGNYGLSYDQSISHMAMWAILAAPLMMGNDLRNIRPEHKPILQNRKVIAVNQDPLGLQGRKIFSTGTGFAIEIWTRPITPVVNNEYSYAVAFVNRRTNDGDPSRMTKTLTELGLNNAAGYDVQELFTDQNYGHFLPTDEITVKINPTGTILLKFTVA